MDFTEGRSPENASEFPSHRLTRLNRRHFRIVELGAELSFNPNNSLLLWRLGGRERERERETDACVHHVTECFQG